MRLRCKAGTDLRVLFPADPDVKAAARHGQVSEAALHGAAQLPCSLPALLAQSSPFRSHGCLQRLDSRHLLLSRP